MKKILLLIFLSFFCICRVEAKTYYSNYSEYSDYTEEIIEASDIVSVDTLNTNRYYKENRIDGEYYYEGENDIEYPIKDELDFITIYEDKLKIEPIAKPGRKISFYSVKYYQDLLKMRYIKISMIEDFVKLYVRSKGLPIEYDTLSYDDYIIIDLTDYYEVEDISVFVDAKAFKVEFLREIDGPVYYDGSFENKKTFINYRSLITRNPEYGEKYETESDDIKGTTLTSRESFYKYEDTLYKYYSLERIYNPLYSYSEEYPNKGEEITLYRYKYRDKIEIMDNIVINDENNLRLDDIVINSTVPYKIYSNLDLAVNGEYNATIMVFDKEIKTNIVVDKKSNLVAALVKEVELNNELKDEVNRLNTIVNNNYVEIKETISTTNEQIDNLSNKLSIEKEKNKILSKDKKDVEEIVVEKKVNKQIFLPICFIIILILDVYFYIRMSMKKEN